ncbi:hypothetical protein AC070_06330 [Fannyhessea vaginae]|nr:hypothetical protein AC070_06330 [Fannyhessea vaginae]
MVVGKRHAVYRLLSMWMLNHLGISTVASGEDVGISSERVGKVEMRQKQMLQIGELRAEKTRCSAAFV